MKASCCLGVHNLAALALKMLVSITVFIIEGIRLSRIMSNGDISLFSHYRGEFVGISGALLATVGHCVQRMPFQHIDIKGYLFGVVAFNQLVARSNRARPTIFHAKTYS